MRKEWKLLESPENKVKQLAKKLNIPEAICRILYQRGLHDEQDADFFFHPELSNLHSPFLMKDMGNAISRIISAVENEEKILLYGDYDVDGTCSVALMHRFLTFIGADPDFYIPDRYTEGYGVSQEGIKHARKIKAHLIIAMDCGIKAFEEVKLATSWGIDFIICDHHLPEANLPEAITILDPKRKDCAYPYKELCGCGITFKLIQGLFQKLELDEQELWKYLDLVALATSCDIVSLDGENRILVSHGLKQINEGPNPGIQALIQNSGKSIPLTVSDLVFGIGPRINAAGRISKAYEAVKLLISSDPDEIITLASKIETQNNARKIYEKKIIEEAFEQINDDKTFFRKKSIVLYNPSWHKGVIGIAASKIVDKFHKPTIILTESQGLAVGSARTAGNFNIYSALQSCSEYLDAFGGHYHAAGLSMQLDKLEDFENKLEETVAQSIEAKDELPQILVSSQLDLEEIDESFMDYLKKLAPFGPSNRNPVFVSTGLKDTGYSEILKEEHLRISIRSKKKRFFNAIAFSQAKHFKLIKSGNFDLCYTIEENHWDGKTYLQLMVKDIRPTHSSVQFENR